MGRRMSGKRARGKAGEEDDEGPMLALDDIEDDVERSSADDESESDAPEEVSMGASKALARVARDQERQSHQLIREARSKRIRMMTDKIHASAEEKRRAAMSEDLPIDLLERMAAQEDDELSDDGEEEEEEADKDGSIVRHSLPAPTRISADGFTLQLLSASKAATSAHDDAVKYHHDTFSRHARANRVRVGKPGPRFATVPAVRRRPRWTAA